MHGSCRGRAVSRASVSADAAVAYRRLSERPSHTLWPRARLERERRFNGGVAMRAFDLAGTGTDHASFAETATSASRADPVRGCRNYPRVPGNPHNPRGRKACSRRESPHIPAYPGSAVTGLSRRRSRVRVPSLPFEKYAQIAVFLSTVSPAFRNKTAPWKRIWKRQLAKCS
jgi:hypothetical protein